MIDVQTDLGISKDAEIQIYLEMTSPYVVQHRIDAKKYNERYAVCDLYKDDLFILKIMRTFSNHMGHHNYEWMSIDQSQFRDKIEIALDKFYNVTRELSMIGVEFVVA